MSRAAAPPPVCDGPGCGKQKQETNRWWIIGITEGATMGNGPVILVAPFGNGEFDPRFKLYDFCGETCALKFLSEQMGKVTS